MLQMVVHGVGTHVVVLVEVQQQRQRSLLRRQLRRHVVRIVHIGRAKRIVVLQMVEHGVGVHVSVQRQQHVAKLVHIGRVLKINV